jgi:hypothetical protein
LLADVQKQIDLFFQGLDVPGSKSQDRRYVDDRADEPTGCRIPKTAFLAARFLSLLSRRFRRRVFNRRSGWLGTGRLGTGRNPILGSTSHRSTSHRSLGSLPG